MIQYFSFSFKKTGQERFQTLVSPYYKHTHGFILGYNINNRDTFVNLKYWLENVKEIQNNPLIVLVGNKCDLEDTREVSFEEGLNWATQKNMLFFETSAKENINIDECVHTLLQEIIKRNLFIDLVQKGNIILKTPQEKSWWQFW